MDHLWKHTHTRCNLTDERDGYNHENVIVQNYSNRYIYLPFIEVYSVSLRLLSNLFVRYLFYLF